MGMYNPLIANLDRIATEFDIFGDHTADVAVGDSQSHQYCFIEFEDAASNSVFRKKGNKATLEWSDRFDHGCSQIIDWLLWLENQKNTQPYLQRFGVHEIQYVGLLVIGRDKFLSDAVTETTPDMAQRAGRGVQPKAALHHVRQTLPRHGFEAEELEPRETPGMVGTSTRAPVMRPCDFEQGLIKVPDTNGTRIFVSRL